MEEKQWIRDIKNGKKEYLSCIAEKYYDDIYRFCCYQTGSAEDAYDITQETFLRFIRNVERYQSRNLKGYLLTIAMNLCRDYFRAKKKEKPIEPDDKLTLNNHIADNDIAKKEQQLMLMESLSGVTDDQREAILLHHYYGFKFREIGKMTGCSTATAKSRVKQGIDKLKKQMEKEGM